MFSSKRRHTKSEATLGHTSASTGEAQHLLIPAGPSSLRVVLATRDTATRIWFRRTVSSLLSKYDILDPTFDLDIQVGVTGGDDRQPGGVTVLSDPNASDDPTSADKSAAENGADDSKRLWRHSIANSAHYGRPRVPLLIQDEAARASENERSLGVFVCGPSNMQNVVRNAVVKENLNILRNPRSGGTYLHMEHFSWA